MNDPKHFLSRWSRKKHEEKRVGKRDEKRDAAAPSPVDSAPDAARAPDEIPRKPAETAQSAASTPTVDLASLPSIDSIGAQTDISAFLKPGVPSELRHAALRRAWSVDPAIRDFKGLQENDWNFNDPNGIPGFGPLSPDIDVKKMASALFGESSKARAADDSNSADPQTAASMDNSADANADGDGRGTPTLAMSGSNPVDENSPKQSDLVQRKENIASQNEKPESVAAKYRRPRGGALPQ